MRLSNKSTFSLACLILLLLAFVAMPVWSHPIPLPDTDPVEYDSTHGNDATSHLPHAIARSITLTGDAADGYVNTDSFAIRIEFDSAGGAPMDFEANNVMVDGTGDWTVRDVAGSGRSYTARVLPPSPGTTTDTDVVISLTGSVIVTEGAGEQAIFTAPDPDPDGATGPLAAGPEHNPAKAVLNQDIASPVIADGTDETPAAPAIQALAGRFRPLDSEWADPFRLVFTLVIAETDMSFDQKTITKASFSASPDEVTFGNPGALGNNMFGVDITPKPAGTTDKSKVDVTITITLTDKAGNSTTAMVTVTLALRKGTGTTTDPDPDPDPDPPDMDTPETGDPSDAITIPANSYVIVGKTARPAGLPDSVTSAQPWGQIPDLEDLFYRGGTILLTVKEADETDARQYAHRDVIITEIMWALNNAEIGDEGETSRQWIEVYNSLDVSVNVILSGKYGRTASTAPSGEIMLDRVSNVVGAGWKLEGLGQNGFDDDVAAESDNPANYGSPNIDFVSMYRKERGKDGWEKGHWAQSTEIYLSGHKGTPGTSERGAVGTIGSTSFTVGAIVFNEIANRDNANKAYEWIELRNKSGGTVNVKNWQISIVTGVGSDNTFFTFPNTNRNIAAGGLLLLVATDPAGDPNHPLATGWNVTKNANNQVNGVGAHSPPYMVANFAGNGLPDDGKFVLILRNHNNKRGKAEHLIDIAGFDDNLTVSANEAGYTNLWPLSGGVRSATLSNNKLEKDQVHRRQRDHIWGTSSTNYGRNGGNHHDDAAWRGVGWTSVGYKRNAARNNAHGGTPGYQNNAVKSEGGDAIASVVISEIMFDTSRNLPQWLEIQNLSNTYGINLNNWSLFIVNHHLKADGEDYTEGKLSERVDIDGELPPNQTMLVVSTASRSYTNLPDERVFNLRRGRGEKLLNPNGFQITLKAKTNEGDARKHQTVDTVGNLGDAPEGSRRSDDQSFEDTLWNWPAGKDEKGNRVSIARKTSSKVTADGTTPGAWVSSMDDSRLSLLREFTYYGHPNDVSSPGQTAGTPLPVSLSFFRPTLENGEIVIRWTTESELDNAGFNILRSDSQSGEFKQVNSELVQGAGTTGERNTYKWVDESAKLGVVYYYQIEDVSFAGERQTLTTTRLKGLISANNKLTTLWGGLKSQQD